MCRSAALLAYLTDSITIDFEVCIWMRLVRVEDLLDCNRPDCVLAIATLHEILFVSDPETLMQQLISC